MTKKKFPYLVSIFAALNLTAVACMGGTGADPAVTTKSSEKPSETSTQTETTSTKSETTIADTSPEDTASETSAGAEEDKTTTTAEPATNVTPSSACVTNGSGGPTTKAEGKSFTSSAGTTSSYHIYPSTASEPSGLLVYLHGDGAYSFSNPGSMNSVRKVAEKHNLAVLTPRVPSGSGDSWWKKPDRNGEWLQGLIKEVGYNSYKIDKSRVVMMGFSGGSDFTSLYFLPKHWETLSCGGGAVLNGGGGKPFWKQDFSDDFVSKFKMHYYTGLNDNGNVTSSCNSDYDALETSKAGTAHYKNLGFSVTSEHPAGIDHCNVEQGDVLSRQLDKGLIPS